MARTMQLRCSTGISRIDYAWVNSSGVRIPSSGTNYTTGTVTLTDCDHVWISSVTPKSNYDAPFYCDGYGTFYGSITLYPDDSIYTYNVSATYSGPSTYSVTHTIYRRNYGSSSWDYMGQITESGLSSGYTYTPSDHQQVGYSGYTYSHSTYGGNRYDPGNGFTMPESDIVIYDYYEQNVYSYYLRYSANGGSGAPGIQSAVSASTSQSFTVPSTTPTRIGYRFLGWSFSSTATSPSYSAGDTISLSYANSDRTLYAVWAQTIYYTVTVDYHDYDSGTYLNKSDTETVESGTTFYPTTAAPGSITYGGATYYEYGDINGDKDAAYHIASNITIKWYYRRSEVTYYLRYDYNYDNKGQFTWSSQSSRTGSASFTVTSLVPTRDGYDFLGWAWNRNASAAELLDGATVVLTTTTDATLYAVWKAKKSLIAPRGTIQSYEREYDTLTITVALTAALEKGYWGMALSTDGVSVAVYGNGTSDSLSANSTCTTTFSGLSANTTYYVLLYNTDDVTSEWSGSIGSVSTKKSPISAFSWTSNDAANIVSGNSPSMITAAKWNELGSKISDVSVRNGSGSVSFTQVVKGQRITHNLFNEANAGIGNLVGHGVLPENQSKGNRMLASLFIMLKTAINNAITYSNNNYR